MSKQLPVTLDAHTFPGSTKPHLSSDIKLFSFYLRQGSVQSQGHAVPGRHPSFPHTVYFRAYSTAICVRLLLPRIGTYTNTLGEACGTRNRPRARSCRNLVYHFTASSHHRITSTNEAQVLSCSNVAMLLGYGEEEMNRPKTHQQFLSHLQLKFRYK